MKAGSDERRDCVRAAGVPARSVTVLALRVAPEDIAYVKFLFESYEGVGIVRTLDRRTAIIVALVVPDFVDTAQHIVAELREQHACDEVPLPAVDTDDWLMRELDADGC